MLTRIGVTILFSVHQPSMRILNQIDSVLLLNQGSLMLQCDTNDLDNYLENIGYPIPKFYSATEWMLELTHEDKSLIEKVPAYFCNDVETGCIENVEEVHHRDRVNTITQLRILVGREVKNLKRDKQLWIITLSSGTFLSLIYGVILYGVGRKDRQSLLNIQGQHGSLVNMLITVMMSNVSAVSAKTPQERPVFLRE